MSASSPPRPRPDSTQPSIAAQLFKLLFRFNEVERQLKELQKQKPSPSTLEKDWAVFEAEQELEQLRRDAGLC